MIALGPLLAPFIQEPLSPEQFQQLQAHLELLLKWNAKISLTAIRDPQEIVRRHFGESLFTGAQLDIKSQAQLADLGSGAGFPGLPIAVLRPEIKVTLIESQQKKVAFLREVIRSANISNASVYAGRAEEATSKSQIVTVRAVEKFNSVLPIAASLLEAHGELALLIGAAQAQAARTKLLHFEWKEPVGIPESRERVLLVGSRSTTGA
jgi:16S rRNA (guanine527-N7)-methyltransferase